MKNSKTFKVVYNANDNLPEDVCHNSGRIRDFNSVKTKTFDNSVDAINFYYDCWQVISPLADLVEDCEISQKVRDLEEMVISEEPVATLKEQYHLVEEED